MNKLIIVGLWNPLTWFRNDKKDDQSSAPTPAPAPETDYSMLIYGRPGIEMNPPLAYDQGEPIYSRREYEDPSRAQFYRKAEVPTADFVKKVTSGEPFRVPELFYGTSLVYRDQDGLPITPVKRDEFGSRENWRVQKPVATQGPIRYGTPPKNPQIAQDLAAYRSQQPESPTVRYTKPFNIWTATGLDVADLRKDFRTPEARKAASDEKLQRDTIRQQSKNNAAKARAEREAQERAREAQARELKKATATQTRFSQMAAKQGADASRRAAEKEIARTTSDLQTSRILGKEIASKLKSQIQTTRDRSEALRQSQANLASATNSSSGDRTKAART